jgi:hypothetical protein
MKKDLDRNCLTRKVLIEKIGHYENIFVSPGVYVIEHDINYMPSFVVDEAYLYYVLGVPAEYLTINTQSCSSAGLEHHVDNVGVVGSNPTKTTTKKQPSQYVRNILSYLYKNIRGLQTFFRRPPCSNGHISKN